MWETYRMLGKEREAELCRTAARTRRKGMDSSCTRPKGMAAAGLLAAIAALVVLVAAASGEAGTNLTKQQWKKQADALCAAAIAKNHKHNPLYPAAKAAAVGGLARAIAAAKSGNEQAFMTAARRADTLVDKAHAAARGYGLRACARW